MTSLGFPLGPRGPYFLLLTLILAPPLYCAHTVRHACQTWLIRHACKTQTPRTGGETEECVPAYTNDMAGLALLPRSQVPVTCNQNITRWRGCVDAGEPGPSGVKSWIWIGLGLNPSSVTCCVTMGECLHLSENEFPHLRVRMAKILPTGFPGGSWVPCVLDTQPRPWWTCSVTSHLWNCRDRAS